MKKAHSTMANFDAEHNSIARSDISLCVGRMRAHDCSHKSVSVTSMRSCQVSKPSFANFSAYSIICNSASTVSSSGLLLMLLLGVGRLGVGMVDVDTGLFGNPMRALRGLLLPRECMALEIEDLTGRRDNNVDTIGSRDDDLPARQLLY